MRPITVNLATHPFRNNRTVAAILGSASVLLLALIAYNIWIFVSYAGTYAEIQGQERTDRARLDSLGAEDRSFGKEIAARDFRRVFDRGRFANDMILRRAFSWTQLFNTLEAVIPPDVMMSAIRPTISGDGILVRVEGLAKSSEALYGFQARLMGSPAFANVSPMSERKLNPSRPDITFVMSFEYRPKRATAFPPALTASAPDTHTPVAAAIAGPEVAPAAPRPGPGPAAGTVATAADAAPPARGTVGRDGMPRDGPAATRVVAAPGALRIPAGIVPAAGQEEAAEQKRPSAARGGRSARSGEADRDPSSGPRSPVGGAASGAGAAMAAERVLPAGPGPSASGVPGSGAPGSGSPGSPTSGSAPKPSPAVRLDVPLRFANRPVGEVYDALARAHGVQFAIDPGVDRGARVSADLGGRPLPDAVTTLGQAAGHRIVRIAEGRYRVALASGGVPLADKPVREETLDPREGAP